jgi:Winged helix DNA-binding domain
MPHRRAETPEGRVVISGRQLNRATLDRQMLLRRQAAQPAQALRRVVGLQAQDPAGPYLALWNRIEDFDPAQLDAAFADRSVVKASLLRLTLHVVHSEDWRWIHTAMLPTLRASRLKDRRFVQTGLSTADADELLTGVTEFVASPRTSTELERFIQDRLGERKPRVWWALKMYAPFQHAPTAGAWGFGRESWFVAAPTEPAAPSRQECVSRLLRRYLAAYGPAEIRDFTQFTLLRQPVVRQVVAALDDELRTLEGPGGRTIYDLAGAQLPDQDVPAPPRLLGMWDGVLLAYAGRGRVLPDQYRSAVIRRNGDVLPSLLVDGYVAGVWRPVDKGVEVRAFRKLDRATWAGVGEEAAGLAALLAARDPGACQRFDHWWDKNVVAGAESRVLPG